MDSSSRRNRRARIRRKRITGPPEATIGPPGADQIVSDAEDILADAWVQSLIGLRDRRLADARSSAVRCERARHALDAALMGGEPGRIASRHSDLEQVLRNAGAAYDRYAESHQNLTAELERQWWRSVRRTVEACIARNGPAQVGESETTGW